MIRRALALAACLSLTLGVGSALATGSNERHQLCIGTSSEPGTLSGICVWVPTD
jgi:hypothetical protein